MLNYTYPVAKEIKTKLLLNIAWNSKWHKFVLLGFNKN